MIFNSKYNFLSACILLLAWHFVLVGCGQKPDFTETIVFAENVWADGNNLAFEFDISDSVAVFDMNLVVNLNREVYPYQNLYVKVITSFPSGEQHDQILSLNLFSRIGYAEGSCRGEICEVPITIQQNIFFPEKGLYKLELLPWMRMDTIPGVHSIRLDIFEAEA